MQALNVVVADARNIYLFDTRTIAMARLDDGIWQAEVTPKKVYLLGYSIFFFQDENGRIDNNHGQYWEILHCFRSQIEPSAVETQASTYEGRLLAPGVQRAPDLERAIEILKADLKARPSEVKHYVYLWDLELKNGGYSRAGYEQVGIELNSFISAHRTDYLAMREVLGFVPAQQRRLPPEVVQRFRNALTALPQTADPVQINAVTKEIIHIPRTDGPGTAHFVAEAKQDVRQGLALLDYGAINLNESDPRRKAEAYLSLASKYPATSGLPNLYGSAFFCEKAIGDVTAVEAMFEKWNAADPAAAQPNLEMAKFYVERKIKPARAVELLDSVGRIYAESELPTSHHHFQRQPGQLKSLRGQAHLLLGDLPAARADFAMGAKGAPDDSSIAFALGQTCEQMGAAAEALDAYLAAASAPYQANSAPREAYERLFVAQRLGNRQEAGERIARRTNERTHSAAVDYVPIAMNRPAPDFAFVDLGGKRFDNQAARGKPTVLTFWGIWCAPCLAELPAIERFQKQHSSVNMLAVEIGNTPDEVKMFLTAHKLDALHVASRTDWPEAFGANGAPTSVVMDRFGQIQFFHLGQLANVEAILGKDLSALPKAN